MPHLNQKGVALVEFAIILPFFLLLVFGAIEFGLLFYNKQVITNASREGARWAIVQTSEEPFRSSSSVAGVVQDYWTKNKLISFGGSSPASKTKDVASGDVLTTTQNVCTVATLEKDITVEVTYEYEFLVFDSIVKFFSGSLNSTIPISGSTTMRCETPTKAGT